MDRHPTDFDLAVEGEIGPLVRLLSKRLGAIPVRHDEFGTASFDCGQEQVDLARTRTETYPTPGLLPHVRFGPFDQDLGRRDFSVNAIAVSLARADQGQIYDPFDGERDIRRRLIRVLHDRSFIDDPTRIFRAFRYKNRLGFRIESHTARLLRAAVRGRMITRLTGQRVLNEYRLIFSEPNFLKTLDDLVCHRIIRFPRSQYQILSRMADARLCYFFSVIGPQAFPLASAERKLSLELSHGRQACYKLARARSNSRIYHILSRFSLPALDRLPAFDPQLRSKMETYKKLRLIKPFVNGRDLKRLGIPTGPRYRLILDKLHDLQLDKKVRTKRETLALIKHV